MSTTTKTFKTLAAAALLTSAVSLSLTGCHQHGNAKPNTKSERNGCGSANGCNANGCKGKNSCKDKKDSNSCKH